MKTELQTKVIQWIESSAVALKDFTTKEVPPFIHEYLQWKFIEACYNSILLLIVSIPLIIIAYKCGKKFKQGLSGTIEEFLAYVIGGIFVACIAITSCVNMGIHVKEAIMIKLAPKVYLIEKTAELIK
jgi:hypothetical protein